MRLFSKLSVSLCILSTLSSPAFAEWISFGRPSASPAEFRVLESSPERTRLELVVYGIERETIVIEGVPHAQIRIPEMNSTTLVGYPEVPRLGKNILIPQDAKVDVRIVSLEEKTVSVGPVVPSKGSLLRSQNPEEVPYSFAPVYRSAQVYPQTLGTPDTFRLRDVQGLNLQLHPVRVNLASGEIRVATRLVVDVITHTRGPGRMLRGSNVVQAFHDVYRNSFVNADRILPDHLIEDNGRLLIIADPLFADAMKPLVAWRTQRGMNVSLATTAQTGKTPAKIQAFIQKAYDQEKISYVLLVGDAEQLPPFPGTAGNVEDEEADPMYGLVDGKDSYPDLFVSRFSAKTVADVENQVARTVNYEKSPDAKGNWYSKGAGIASSEGGSSGAADYERANVLRELMLKWHYTSVDQIYEPSAKKTDISKALNDGRGYLNYIGHGSDTSWGTTGFNIKDIDALANGSKLPFIVSVACVNGNFGISGSDSFAERWLKAGTASAPKGAIAIFASSTNQSWVPPTVGQKAITELLVNEKFNTIGTLFMHGSVAVLEDKDSTAEQTFQSWHIFGDAALQVRTKAPTRIEASLPEEVGSRERGLTLNLGEPGLTLALTQDGTLVGTGISDANGTVTLDTGSLVGGRQALWTVTGFNKIPFEKSVAVR